jgi:preprotein translocase subunit SecD
MVAPSGGTENLHKGLTLCIVGLTVVIALLWAYQLGGIVSTIAVSINLLLNVVIAIVFGATFILPSIAALVLAVGMLADRLARKGMSARTEYGTG